ncbi:alpha-ketoglutarate-dependent taurine dioxygenase [Bradyrhizobium sp. GM24.11]
MMRNATIVDAFIPRANIIKRAPRLGAEIVNVRLSAEMSQNVLCAIRELVREHRVIFFRDQKHLDDAEHERVVAMLGNVSSQPPLGAPSVPLSTVANDSDDHWSTSIIPHVDTGLSVLRSETIAPAGRETAWSDMRAAYLDLPLPLRKLADDLWAIHDESAQAAESGAAEANTKDPDERLLQTDFEVDHPVVRIHPVTGERVLALGNVAGRFVGLRKDTGQKLYHLLQSYVTAPENAVRWTWKAGDIAIWDNCAAQHHPVDGKKRGATYRDNLSRSVAKREWSPRPAAADDAKASGSEGCLTLAGFATCQSRALTPGARRALKSLATKGNQVPWFGARETRPAER